MSETPPTKLYTALLAAARDFGPVLKNANNPAFRTKYADLGAVLDAVTEPLANHGILLLQRFTHDQGGALLITELVHAESGQSTASVVPVVAKDPTDPQKMGGAITYYRRYSLLALLGLAPEDDDGHAASQPAPRRQQPTVTVPQSGTTGQRVNVEHVERPAPAPNGHAHPADVDAINPHPEGSVEHVLFEARRLAIAGEPVPEVWRFLTSRQKALGADWDTVKQEWSKTIKPLILAG